MPCAPTRQTMAEKKDFHLRAIHTIALTACVLRKS